MAVPIGAAPDLQARSGSWIMALTWAGAVERATGIEPA